MESTESASLSAGALGTVRVASFESRMAGALASLIRKRGAIALEAPTLREIPIEAGENPQALRFADALEKGQYDAVLFLTGVGTRYLAQVISDQRPDSCWLEALANVTVIARGPKPVAALGQLGVRIDLRVPEPNTWREILTTVEAGLPRLNGIRMAVQEYGQPNDELVQGLERLGIVVDRVPVYRWALPEDLRPLRETIAAIVDDRVDAALFTSAQQVVHLLQVAEQEGQAETVRNALCDKVLVGSIGPITTDSLRNHGIIADFEPEHPKMGHLVARLAKAWLERQGKATTSGGIPAEPKEFPKSNVNVEAEGAKSEADRSTPADQGTFLRACRREPTEYTPIWLMRQAGRFMPEYRAVREGRDFLDLCKRPELACQVTVEAAEILGVDAAILFADILLILEPLGFSLQFTTGDGPVIDNPIQGPDDLDRVETLETAEPLNFVNEAVRQIRRALRPETPLIGFAGAPFTLASYAIEGGSSKNHARVKAFMYREPEAWARLMDRFADATAVYLNAQVEAGAQALQLFDSWIGVLSPSDYRRFVLPTMTRLFGQLRPGVPVIHFGTGTATLLELQQQAGGTVIGLDWRVELDEAWRRLGTDRVAVQGNLDPIVLLSNRDEISRQAHRILEQASGRPGHIFNLGHGILPSTPVDHVRALVEIVHEYRA